MQFNVNESAVTANMINGEIQARMTCMMKNPNNHEAYKESLKKYQDANIVGLPIITSFMVKHPEVFKNKKLIKVNSNIFEECTALAPSSNTDNYLERLKSRMTIGGDVTPEEIEEMDGFFKDLEKLPKEPEMQKIIAETEGYKRVIERLWAKNERKVMQHIKSILGYHPKVVKDIEINVVFPNIDTNKVVYGTSGEKMYFLFGERREKSSAEKIVANLSHQAVHQPMLPYKSSMVKEEKETFHSFIKFLTNKEIYHMLSEKSYLDIITPGENPETMGKVYPYWLGYRYRNVSKEGLNPAEEIEKAIERDKSYFDAMPQKSRKRKLYANYHFEKLDSYKIAEYFRDKKGITPYEFNKIDFNNKENVYKQQYLTTVRSKKKPSKPNIEGNIR